MMARRFTSPPAEDNVSSQRMYSLPLQPCTQLPRITIVVPISPTGTITFTGMHTMPGTTAHAMLWVDGQNRFKISEDNEQTQTGIIALNMTVAKEETLEIL